MEGFSENSVKVNQSCGGCKNVSQLSQETGLKLGFTSSLPTTLEKKDEFQFSIS